MIIKREDEGHDIYVSNAGIETDGLKRREKLVNEALARTSDRHDGMSDEAYMEALYPQEHDEYLVDGAQLQCSMTYPLPQMLLTKMYTPENACCTTKLKVTENPKAKCCTDLSHATVHDCKKGVNIEPFRCNCALLPIGEEWEKVLADEACRTEGTCRALMDLEEIWDNFEMDRNYLSFEDDAHGISQGISMTSMLFCRHGGLITPVNSGQTEIVLDEMESYMKLVMETLGWSTDTEELKELHAILDDFGITDKNSITCFFLICISESGKAGTYVGKTDRNGDTLVDEYGRAVVEDYPIGYKPSDDYDFNDRGAGYIHVTGKENQKACLTYLQEKGYYTGTIDENAEGYVNELRQMPWASAAWRWAVYEQPKYTHMNDYVAERSAENGNYLTEGVFLTAECFINGLVSGNVNDVLHKVARNQTAWEVSNGRLIADGKNLPAPGRWDAFHDNYESLVENGIIFIQNQEW